MIDKIKISTSRIGLQKDCLGKYYYNYILKVPVERRTWPATIIGTSIHSYIENYLGLISKESDIKKLPPLSVTYQNEKKNTLDNGEKIGKPRGYNEEESLREQDLWIKDIMRFLFLFLPTGKKVFEEEINIDEKEYVLNGFIDLQILGEENYIFDFKTTKSPNKYFFVQWERDPQSLLYMYAKRASSFSYLVFDGSNKLILSQSRGSWNENDENNFKAMIDNFLSLHLKASDTKLWSPSQDNCRWCDYKNICSRAIK